MRPAERGGGEFAVFITASRDPGGVEERSVIGMGGCKMREARAFQHIARSLIGGQVAGCCSSAPIPDP